MVTVGYIYRRYSDADSFQLNVHTANGWIHYATCALNVLQITLDVAEHPNGERSQERWTTTSKQVFLGRTDGSKVTLKRKSSIQRRWMKTNSSQRSWSPKRLKWRKFISSIWPSSCHQNWKFHRRHGSRSSFSSGWHFLTRHCSARGDTKGSDPSLELVRRVSTRYKHALDCRT